MSVLRIKWGSVPFLIVKMRGVCDICIRRHDTRWVKAKIPFPLLVRLQRLRNVIPHRQIRMSFSGGIDSPSPNPLAFAVATLHVISLPSTTTLLSFLCFSRSQSPLLRRRCGLVGRPKPDERMRERCPRNRRKQRDAGAALEWLGRGSQQRHRHRF